MTDAKEFLEGWFAAFYRFDGLILVLQAFFDETGSGENDELTAVAGFVYDKEGLENFTKHWGPEVSNLSGHYRSSPCNAGQEPFRLDDWPEQRRQKLMDKLATLSADHALAAFVVATGREDFEAARENIPGIRRFLDSPYTMCAVNVLAMASSWVESARPGEKVYCWFEAGGPGEKKTVELVTRLIIDPETKDIFSFIKGRAWIPKEGAPALCSADLLAWEWRQNVLKSQDVWTPRMYLMMERMQVQSKPILPHHITGNALTRSALLNLFPGFLR